MTLFLPVSFLEGIERAQLDADQEHADALIDRLLAEVEAKAPSMLAVASETAARQMTAAVFLLRACELLKEIRAADGDAMLQSLGLRSVFELAAVGRYLMTHPNGADEFRRRLCDALVTEERTARAIGVTPGGAPDFLAHITESEQKGPRTLADIVDALDQFDGRSAGERYSAAHAYNLVYRYVSNAGTHANVLSAKRFLKRDDALLSIDSKPPPIFEEPAVLLVTCFVRELADVVFAEFQLPVKDLPSELRRPTADDLRDLAAHPDGSSD